MASPAAAWHPSLAMRGLSLLCLLLTACSPSRRAWQPEALPPSVAAPAAFAVVRLDTPLALAPREGAPVLWAVAPREIYAGATPRYGAFRVLGQERDWVSLETLGEPRGAHCAESLEALEPFRLRVFVPSRALAPVTQREVAQPFADATRIELARGVPLEPVAPSLFRAHLGALSAVVRLAPAEIGTRYLPSAPPPPLAPSQVLSAEALRAGVPVLGQTGRVESLEAAPVYAAEPRGGEALVELRPPCARIVARVPSHTLAAPEASIPAPPTQPDGARVRQGARISWRDGGAAGVVTREVALAHEVEPAGVLRCFRYPLRPSEDGDPSDSIELCFDRHDVADPSAGPANRLDAPG